MSPTESQDPASPEGEPSPGAPQDQPGPGPEEWVYLGPHRTLAGGSRWRDAGDVIRVYKKFPARIFGGIYTIQVERDRADDRVFVRGDPVWAGRHAEDAAQIQIEALLIEAALKAARLERQAPRAQQLDEALAPLLDIAGSLRSMQDRRALLEYVTAKVYRA